MAIDIIIFFDTKPESYCSKFIHPCLCKPSTSMYSLWLLPKYHSHKINGVHPNLQHTTSLHLWVSHVTWECWCTEAQTCLNVLDLPDHSSCYLPPQFNDSWKESHPHSLYSQRGVGNETHCTQCTYRHHYRSADTYIIVCPCVGYEYLITICTSITV